MWHTSKKVAYTYSTNHSQNAWAYIDTVGWRKIKPSTADGVTNIFIMLNAAKANDRLVNVYIDTVNQITRAYLK